MTWISSAIFLGLQVIVHFINISGIVDNHCLHDQFQRNRLHSQQITDMIYIVRITCQYIYLVSFHLLSTNILRLMLKTIGLRRVEKKTSRRA
jgi:hypothetical protein